MNELIPDPDESNWHIRLRRAIVEYFDEDELETICFDLRVDFDELEGENKTQKTISLITLLARLERIDQLIMVCSEMRPNVPWTELRTAAQSNPLIVEENLVKAKDSQPLTAKPPKPGQAFINKTQPTNLRLILILATVAVVVLGIFVALGLVIQAALSMITDPVFTREIEQPTETSPNPAAADGAAATPTILASTAVLLSEDFESSPTQAWRSVSGFSNPAVARLADGNHALQIRQDVDALYSPSWNFEVSDYWVEADVMVVDLQPDTSIGWNVRMVSQNSIGYCQGYRAEIGQDYSALHLITAPGENCDSIWNYETLNNGEFILNAGEWHRLRLDIMGNRLHFYIDGDLVLTATDQVDRYPGGGVGIIVFESQEAYADNVLIMSLAKATADN